MSLLVFALTLGACAETPASKPATTAIPAPVTSPQAIDQQAATLSAPVAAQPAATEPAAPKITLPPNITPSIITALRARTPITSGVIDTTKLKFTPNAPGSRAEVFNGPSGTLQNFECHITTVNPGQSAHTPHSHPHEEMLIIKEGTLEVYIAGKTYVAGPGSIIFYGPNDPHGTKNIGNVPATYYVFTWVTDQTGQPDTTTPASGITLP